jgi:hypothetical protein
MAANSGFIGLGAALKIGDGASPEAFAAIANVKSISGPGRTAEIVDTTHLGSTGGYREKRPHLKDSGVISAEMSFDPNHATHKNAAGGLIYIFENRLLKNFLLDWTGCVDASGTAMTWGELFAGYVTNLSQSTPMDDLVTMSLEITLTGASTLTDLS